jgi:GrpB-like predicted nucleotidyltransferase (UPF0157 family)
MADIGSHKVILVGYDPEWVVAFDAAAGDLLDSTGDHIATVENIGSTAIPGLESKPVIDLLAEFARPDFVPGLLSEAISPLGYVHRAGESTDRPLFSRWDTAVLTHNLHVVSRGTMATRNEILFRDRLRRDQAAMLRYAEVKRWAAARSYVDAHGYSRAKTDFVFAIVSEERERLGLGP